MVTWFFSFAFFLAISSFLAGEWKVFRLNFYGVLWGVRFFGMQEEGSFPENFYFDGKVYGVLKAGLASASRFLSFSSQFSLLFSGYPKVLDTLS